MIDDVLRAFHHPANRDERIEIQRMMYDTVLQWTRETHYDYDDLLSSESVKEGHNHVLNGKPMDRGSGGGHTGCGADGGHGKVAGSLWSKIQTRALDTSSPVGGGDGRPSSSTGRKYGYSSSSSSHHQIPTHGEAASYFSSADQRPASPPGHFYGSRLSSSGYGSSAYGSGRPSPAPASFGYHHAGHQAYEGSSGFPSQPSYGGSSGPSYGGSSQPSYGSQPSYPSRPSYGSQPPYGGPPHSPYGAGHPPSPPRPSGYGGGYAGYSAGPTPSHGGYGSGPAGGAPPYPYGGPVGGGGGAPYPHGGRANTYERNYDQHYDRDDRHSGREGRRRRGSRESRSSSEERDGRGYPGCHTDICP